MNNNVSIFTYVSAMEMLKLSNSKLENIFEDFSIELIL